MVTARAWHSIASAVYAPAVAPHQYLSSPPAPEEAVCPSQAQKTDQWVRQIDVHYRPSLFLVHFDLAPVLRPLDSYQRTSSHTRFERASDAPPGSSPREWG